MENERVITKEMGMKFKEENNLEAFIETSAKNDDIKKFLLLKLLIVFMKIEKYYFLRFVL